MWDYSFAVPSILILGVLLINYFSLKRLPIRLNKYFVRLLIVEAIVITTDIWGSWVLEKHDVLPYWYIIVINQIFFIAFVIRPFVFFAFSASVFMLDPRENRLRTFICMLPMLAVEVVVLLTPFTGAIFSVEETGYVRGPMYSIINYLVIVYLILCFIQLIMYRKNVENRRQYYTMIAADIMLAVGITMRMNFPKYLMMDTFCLMNVLLFYLSFMNPDNHIDERTQLFNEDAFKRYLLELERMKHTSMLAFTIKNYTELREIYGANQMNAGISMIGSFLNKNFPKAICFYHRKGRFVIMTKPDANQDAMIEIISERFGKSWAAVDVELYLEVCFAKMDACYINYDKDTIIYTLGNVASRMETDIENTIYLITDTDLHQMEDSKNVRVALENAVRDNKVEVFLQPIVDAGDYSLVGAEALCRIRDAKGNIVPPGEFISVAERNGRIIQLGELVFEETCRFLATYDIYAMGISWINVNLSALQFLKSDLPENFEHIAKEYGVPPARIHLEITEAAIIDEATMEAQISRFISKGFAFSLDDYGTGYSNATRINKFAFTNIKIDMSVVWDYINSPNIILPMMIKSFKRMGYTVTAEGIESDKMGQTMRELGCDYLQGKHFAMPLPIPEFIEKYGE